jgi:peptidyl-prolyl cis-trans isomerase C
LVTNSQPQEAEATASSSQQISRFLREPLLHFVLIGSAIYLLFGLYGQPEIDETIVDKNTIIVTKGEVDWLAESWKKRWNRDPTKEELLGLVKAHLKETVLYREAISMGLDKDDTIVRRRLAQKLTFLTQDLIKPEPPTDDELRAYFKQHIDHYRIPDLLTFAHVFLDPDKRGDQTLVDAEKLKAELIANSKTPDASSDLGDRFMLQSYYPERSEADLSKLFGKEFARSIMALEAGTWHGPVLSGYGTHLVYVRERHEFEPPAFAEVSDRVRENFENEKRKQLNDEYIASLLSRYKVVVEGDDSFGIEDPTQ